MSKIKAAIIGVGGISKHHIEGYLRREDVELYAFCDINEEQLKVRGEQYGITRLYTDKDVMLKELPEIDVVSVCTWNSQHAPCTIAALNAGCHVICEKPMATSAKEAKAMKEAAQKKCRFDFQKKKRCDDGDVRKHDAVDEDHGGRKSECQQNQPGIGEDHEFPQLLQPGNQAAEKRKVNEVF